MNLVESVYELSKSFMKDSELIFINKEKIEHVANGMKVAGKPTFPMPEVENALTGTVMELVAASINYCYWYGKHNVRPNNSSSTTMYETLLEAFRDYPEKQSFEQSIETLIVLLSLKRFPLLEERMSHLRQLIPMGESFCSVVKDSQIREIEPHMEKMLSLFPGFASDMFLKRASLFFIQLFRRFGWFDEDLHNLHVPADYQIPKMLNHYGCLIYDDDLFDAIENNQMLDKHSQPECEIRAATVLAIKMLCDLTSWNVAEVDGYFFTRRHDATNPFHLTITTDY